MDQLLPLLIFTAPARHQAEFTKRLLLAAVPGQLGLAFTAVEARKQISSREQGELKMVQEAAARFDNPEDLEKNAPTLHGIYAGLPEEDQETVKFKNESPGQKPDGSRRPREGLAAALKEQEIKEKQTLGRKA